MHTRFVALTLATLVVAADAAAQTPTPPTPPQALPAPTPRPEPRVRHKYQGGPDQTERFTRKVKLGKNGWFTLGNIAGDIVVSGGTGDEVTIDAVKHTRGEQSQLANLRIDVDERPGRVEVHVTPSDRMDRTWVDFTVTVPADAGVELRSVSGDVTVTAVAGAVRAETVSGNVTASKTPRLERAKSVSGEVTLADAASEGDLSAGSISGSVRATGLKARGLDLSTISGDVILKNVTCDRIGAKSISGTIEYGGTLARSGRYELNSHSGTIRLTLSGNTGFELNASTFSGTIRSDLPLKIGGDDETPPEERGRGRHGLSRVDRRSLRATFGDGTALVTARTFSGNIIVSKGQ